MRPTKPLSPSVCRKSRRLGKTLDTYGIFGKNRLRKIPINIANNVTTPLMKYNQEKPIKIDSTECFMKLINFNETHYENSAMPATDRSTSVSALAII